MRGIALLMTAMAGLWLGTGPARANDPAATVPDAYAEAMVAYDGRDYSGAFERLVPLAEGGLVAAQTLLGTMYRTGLLGIPDYDQAALWFDFAARGGDSAAAFNLGLMYFQGEVLPPGGAKTAHELRMAAVARFREAALEGHAEAQLYLGHMYAEGLGVDRDLVQAYTWYQLAAWQRVDLAEPARDRLAEQLSGEEIRRAKEAAHSFRIEVADASQ